MGIDSAGTDLLFCAKSVGADFSRSAMLGRQFFYPDPVTLKTGFELHNINVSPIGFLKNCGGWSEEFFRLLGAKTVDSFDASEFEGASLIHDFNRPIPDHFKEKFSLVYDGGTLEHVFSFPQALRNAMEILSIGGFFVQFAPANNFMGHGFYQLSPELVYRVFSEENGFETKAVLLQEAVRGGRWYKVSDPATVRKRVQMTGRLPMNLCLIAKRVAICTIFEKSPQQSDYQEGWRNLSHEPSGGVYRRNASLRTKLSRLVTTYAPAGLERFLRSVYSPSLAAQPDCFLRLTERQVIQGTY